MKEGEPGARRPSEIDNHFLRFCDIDIQEGAFTPRAKIIEYGAMLTVLITKKRDNGRVVRKFKNVSTLVVTLALICV